MLKKDTSLKGRLRENVNKGNVANAITFVIMVVGIVLVAIWPRSIFYF